MYRQNVVSTTCQVNGMDKRECTEEVKGLGLCQTCLNFSHSMTWGKVSDLSQGCSGFIEVLYVKC